MTSKRSRSHAGAVGTDREASRTAADRLKERSDIGAAGQRVENGGTRMTATTPILGRVAMRCVAVAVTIAPISVLAQSRPPLAPATTAQLQGAENALNSAPPALKADVAAAGPTLRPYLITLMCVQDDDATRGLVQTYVGSRGTTMFNGWSGKMSPGKRMAHHDMVGCLNVARIQNWRRAAANEFSFDIIFTAPDSGESYDWPTVVHREPDGTWLIA